MNPAIITTLGGISGFIGLLASVVYLYLYYSLKAAQRSISNIIGGEQLFNADQILQILSQFDHDHASRLEALKVLTKYDTANAKHLLTKIEGNIDVSQVGVATSKSGRRLVLHFGIVLLGLSALGLGYTYVSGNYVASPRVSQGPSECAAQQNTAFHVSLHFRSEDGQSKDFGTISPTKACGIRISC